MMMCTRCGKRPAVVFISSTDQTGGRKDQGLCLICAREMKIPQVGIRMGIAVVAVLPVLIIYPFLQKYFVKGIVIGGVKG